MPETALEFFGIGGRDDSLLAEHARMGNRATDVLADHADVEGYGGVVGLQAAVGRLRESAAPGFGCSRLLCHICSWVVLHQGCEHSTTGYHPYPEFMAR